MKSKIEIIEELFDNGYCLNPETRAFDDGACMYLMPDGRKCAVGKCMINPDSRIQGSVNRIYGLENLLKPEYRGHEVKFWLSLQKFA